MNTFARLLDRLAFTPSRNAKLSLLERYFRETPPDEAGLALALLTGTLEIPAVKPSTMRDLVRSRVDPVLFDLSYDFVGDQAETIALLWPGSGGDGGGKLSEMVDALQQGSDQAVASERVAAFLDVLDPVGRWALLKLVTGANLRIGVSARLAKTALARAWGREPDDLEKIWSAFQPPYAGLFAWLEGGGAPVLDHQVYFHPPLLAHPLDEADLAAMDPADYVAEWKWDGIRVQLASNGKDRRRLFSRSGDEISAAFPEVLERADFDAVLDGELLVLADVPRSVELPGAFGDLAPFSRLQQRLNRKRVTARLQAEFPVVLCLYDLLFLQGRDMRDLPWVERRSALESLAARSGWDARAFRLSTTLPFHTWAELRSLRERTREYDMEGLMLKRKNSAYLPGRPKGVWFKWKRNTLNVDAVLMYAQRGHGRRSSFYSDYTFGLWRMGEGGKRELVPVGKAYSGFTDEELARLDKWVREHTLERYGSVRAVAPGLVFEVEFDAVQRSTRHKSGVAMRFPRIQRIRWDKAAEEADRLETLLAMIPRPNEKSL
ncbi:MAG: cisplatin damage response ATP-dependent DNA ligase [Candidatus Methylacidiphilales bacterium]|nr:cisplatin damage response ATP-dependent DNA ligase [Candidatus Methylacidiphilales bacterium]